MSTFFFGPAKTQIPVASEQSSGLMSSADKEVLGSLATGFTPLYREYYNSTTSLTVELSEKNYFVYTCGSEIGTSGTMMDSTNGCLIFVSGVNYAIVHKGSAITVSSTASTLTITCRTAVKMGIVEV